MVKSELSKEDRSHIYIRTLHQWSTAPYYRYDWKDLREHLRKDHVHARVQTFGSRMVVDIKIVMM